MIINSIFWKLIKANEQYSNLKNQSEILNLNTFILFLVFAVIHLPSLCSSHSVAINSFLNIFISVVIPFMLNSLSFVIPFIYPSIPQIFITLSVPPEAMMLVCFKISKAQIHPSWASRFLNTGLLLFACHKLIEPSMQAVANLSWLIDRTLSIAY